jgi:gamma-glutamylcyclotransferase (GGCT)/AIG2-like uncharacterized protein YtfP
VKNLPIFVYGSLKAGADRDIFADLQRSVVPAQLQGASLYDLGYFPGLKLGGSEVVYGELHKYYSNKQLRYVLKLMDQIEGYYGRKTDLYKRVEVAITVETGQKLNAYTYIYNRQVGSASLITSGWWPL